MKKISFCIAAMLLLLSAIAQNKKPVKVLLLGMFHFSNPGPDVRN